MTARFLQVQTIALVFTLSCLQSTKAQANDFSSSRDALDARAKELYAESKVQYKLQVQYLSNVKIVSDNLKISDSAFIHGGLAYEPIPEESVVTHEASVIEWFCDDRRAISIVPGADHPGNAGQDIERRRDWILVSHSEQIRIDHDEQGVIIRPLSDFSEGGPDTFSLLSHAIDITFSSDIWQHRVFRHNEDAVVEDWGPRKSAQPEGMHPNLFIEEIDSVRLNGEYREAAFKISIEYDSFELSDGMERLPINAAVRVNGAMSFSKWHIQWNTDVLRATKLEDVGVEAIERAFYVQHVPGRPDIPVKRVQVTEIEQLQPACGEIDQLAHLPATYAVVDFFRPITSNNLDTSVTASRSLFEGFGRNAWWVLAALAIVAGLYTLYMLIRPSAKQKGTGVS